MVCGTQAFVSEARRVRKALGGGMRQAGILAAAGIVALTEMIDRLAEDHQNARVFAEGLAEINGIAIDPPKTQSNILFFEIKREHLTAEQLVARLMEEGVRVGPRPPKTIRAVTNYHITKDDIDYALGVFRKVMNEDM
jgi:threonine aldolase